MNDRVGTPEIVSPEPVSPKSVPDVARRDGAGAPPELRFHHTGVSVPDLEAAIGWYGSMLGFEVEQRFAFGHTQAAFIRRGSLRFELFQVEGAAPLPEDRRHPPRDLQTHGNKHVAFAIDNLEGFIADMQARGADIPFVVRESFGRGCFLRDCAGNLVEFVEARD